MSHQLAAPYRGLTHAKADEIRIALGTAIHTTYALGTLENGAFVPDPDFPTRSAGIGGDEYAAFILMIDGHPMTETGLSAALMSYMDSLGLLA